MLEGKTIAVVVPCYNESEQVAGVLETMPDYVDCVITVDDASTDGTADVVRRHIDSEGAEPRTVLIALPDNQRVGAAILVGYNEAIRRQIDVTAVMAGDAQMEPKQLRSIIAPVAHNQADYAKANRLYYRRPLSDIPMHRYLGNAFLSMLTKIASGYWHVADSQTGYTAISLNALETIDLDGLYPRYGYPNDLLVRLNVYDFRVADVPLRPVYNVGEQSKMRLTKVVPTMSWLIFKRFCWRMWRKYVIHDFHPLVLFYLAGMLLGLISVGLFVRMLWMWIAVGHIPPLNALAWGFCIISSMQLCLFAMWFDMEMNRSLTPRR
ncbi:MAG: glycosyltransferase family 2 protein [Phycisphaerae bacterium]|nr:glycosyltransferase family 2 protein [Phycisphaerae bacterium]